MALGIFFASTTGLEAQSNALSAVSDNIANINTVGYKSADTQFYTLLGSLPSTYNNASGLASSRVDTFGVGSYTRYSVLDQGVITSTGNAFDVALNQSNAFFALNDGYGDIYYSRAGQFSERSVDGVNFLINNSGYNVQGFAANGDGTFSGTMSDIIIDPVDKMPAIPTSDMEIIANVPATGVDSSAYGLTVYGPTNGGENMNMVFTKVEGKQNTWNIDFVAENGTITGGPIEAVFSSDGKLVSPKSLNITANWNDGTSNNITIHIDKMTQYAGSGVETKISQDGVQSGDYLGSYIDNDGVLRAKYSNQKTMDIAKLAVVSFQAPENLIPVSGTMFEASVDVGESSYLIGPDTNNLNIIVPESVEASNVRVEEEFAEMIKVQRAYNLNSSAFTTANEMVSTAIDLKS